MDNLGNRMKKYEFQETQRTFIPLLPIYARIDGRSFSNFTKGMKRPYDERMTTAMIETTKFLVEETHALIGYCQSDEISLAWQAPTYDSQIFFDGKIMKLASVLGSIATQGLVQSLLRSDDQFRLFLYKAPTFDARVISMPSQEEVANMFLWRNLDATKNAVSMAAHHYFSHKSLQNVGSAEMQERLFQEKGINFNDFPESFKRGTFVRRVKFERVFTTEELERIPAQHRPSPEETVTRSEVRTLSVPIFSKVINRAGFIFNNEEPITNENTEV